MGDGDPGREEARRAALALSIAGCAAAVFGIVVCSATGLPWPVWIGVCGIHAAGFAYVALTPGVSRRDALAIISMQALVALVAIALTSEALAASGRYFVPFNGNKIVAFLIAIFCPSMTVGALLLAACIVGPLVQTAHWGADVRPFIPSLEPIQTLVVVSASLLFLYVRRRHAERIQELARVQAETDGFERVAALGLQVRDRVERLVADLQHAVAALRDEAGGDAAVQRMDRVAYRMRRLSETLTPLSELATPAEPTEAVEARRAAIAVGAIAGFGGALVMAIETIRPGYSLVPGSISLAAGGLALAVALALPRLPARAYHALFVIAGAGAVTMVLLNNDAMASRGHFDAFPGIKLAMLVFAFLAPRAWLGALLIAFGTLGPVIETYAVWTPAQRGHLPMLEPWSTVLFGFIAFGLLVAQRRRAVVLRTLAQARADRDGVERTARMVLALRDLVSSPLQTLMMSIELAYGRVDSAQLDALAAAVARVRELLQTLPVFEIENALAFDAYDDLEREILRVTEGARLTAVARF